MFKKYDCWFRFSVEKIVDLIFFAEKNNNNETRRKMLKLKMRTLHAMHGEKLVSCFFF